MNNLVEKVINYNNTFSMRFFMGKNMTYHRKKIVTIFFAALAVFLILAGRLTWLMIFRSDYYS